MSLPRSDILCREDTVPDHLQVLLTQRGRFGWRSRKFVADFRLDHDLPELVNRLDQLGGELAAVVVSMETIARLGQQLTEQPAEKVIELSGGLVCAGGCADNHARSRS